jgi:hypothetical protein
VSWQFVTGGQDRRYGCSGAVLTAVRAFGRCRTSPEVSRRSSRS